MITDGEQRRNWSAQLSLSEMLTIMIGFHMSEHRTFKMYYLFLEAKHRQDSPNLISDSRFIQWMPS